MTSLLGGLPKHHFGAILADPPWVYKTWTQSQNPQSSRNVERHYKTMRSSDIKALPIAELASPGGCHLFLWATGPNLPLALEVISAWGFKYSGIAFTWIKLRKSFDPNQLRVLPTADRDFHVGLGFTTRKNSEFCLLARRGNARRLSKSVRELILSPRREHSRKPDETRERIEQYCVGPYLDLFSRAERPGWICRGYEAGTFPSVLSAA
jgi:N6-adenosine-specific RNA methylase IME4